MQRTTRALAAALLAALPLSRSDAQIYLVQPGTPYDASAIQSAVLGSQMNGLGVQVTFSDGTTSGGSWGFLFTVGSVDFYGVRNGLFSFSMRGDRDTGGPDPSENDFNLANFNPSGETIVGLMLAGAPGNVVFDRTFGGLTGSIGSSTGRDVVGANDPTGNEFLMTATYRNLVGVAGAPPVGDLFESLDILFGNPVPEDENYSLFLDTDLARSLTAVPEPSALGLVALGLGALALGGRRARR